MPKLVDGNQKAIDALALNSGWWKVKGVPGLYVRCRATSKSFMLQRRIQGELVKTMLGPLTMKAAKEKALAQWGKLEPAADDVLTLGSAIEQYIEAKTAAGKMAPKTAVLYRYNARKYLERWKKHTLVAIGKDRLGIRQLQQAITTKYGPATSNQCVRLLAAVYRWSRDIDDRLPEWPRKAAEIHKIKPRDWAYSADELKAWWSTTGQKDGKKAALGVRTLSPLKKMWWLTALFTGGRKGSIEALRWADVDLQKKILFFRETKGDRPYAVPMADKLVELLAAYRTSEEIPPSEWVFPSPVITDAHIVDVKNRREGVGPAHRMRHTFKTTATGLGIHGDQSKILMGQSLGGDVSRDYITRSEVLESLRADVNKIASRYVEIMGLE